MPMAVQVAKHVGFCFSSYYHYTSAGIVVITAKKKSNKAFIVVLNLTYTA